MNGIKINNKLKEIYFDKGYWTDKTILDYWNESLDKYRDRIFIIDDLGNKYTYGEVDKKASKLASYLFERGIKPQDVISYQLPVWSEFVFISIACLKVGAILNPIGMCYKSEELQYLIEKSKSKIFICPTFYHKTNYEKEILNLVKDMSNLEGIILIDKIKNKYSAEITLNEIFDKYNETYKTTKVNSNDVAIILYTSGTTGGEKGVMLTHNNIIFSEKCFNKELKLTDEDIMFMASPLYHATGFHHGIISPMLLGSKVVIQSTFDSDKAVDLINKEKCTYSMGATPFIYDILNTLEDKSNTLNSLKYYLCGGAPVNSCIIERALDLKIKICEVYGSTESVPHVFVRPEEVEVLMGSSSGRTIEGIEVKVVDENGNEVLPGVVGEEISRGPNVFVGYLDDMDSTNKVLDDDGWYYSGDLCIHDGKGNIKIMGRKKDMIVRGGENLNSNKINDFLGGIEKIQDHAIIGMPDERMGEKICAYVVLKSNFDNINLEELLEYFRQKSIPKRYWPERVEVIDKIPRTDSGKVKKFLLHQDLVKKIKDEETESIGG